VAVFCISWKIEFWWSIFIFNEYNGFKKNKSYTSNIRLQSY